MKLSDKIRILRKARGLSQEQFGYALSEATGGVSRQTVSDWENGKFEPKLDNIRDIAKVLDVSFDVLLDEFVDLNDEGVLDKHLKASTGGQNEIGTAEIYYIRAYDVQGRSIIGEISNVHLMLYNFKVPGNVIRIPLDEVEDIRLGDDASEQRGKLAIFLYNEEKPITSVDVEFPQKAIDFYRKCSKK